MDGDDVLVLPSMKSVIFMDGDDVLVLPSMKSVIFMDGDDVLVLPSMILLIFMDGDRLESICTTDRASGSIRGATSWRSAA